MTRLTAIHTTRSLPLCLALLSVHSIVHQRRFVNQVLCRGILDSMEKQLGLSPSHLVPSRETLRRYGNTSSSSIW